MIQVAIIEHEIGHALGLVHEQQRPDRDNYITVHTDNISQGGMDFFVILDTVYYGVPYDYASVMHSGPKVSVYTYYFVLTF